MLGLLPGSGGTQRLPPLIGLPNALPMMLTGAGKNAKQAKKLGLVDLVIKSLGKIFKKGKLSVFLCQLNLKFLPPLITIQ